MAVCRTAGTTSSCGTTSWTFKGYRLVGIESLQDDQRQVWVLTERGQREAKQLPKPKNVRVPALRKEKYHPVTGRPCTAWKKGGRRAAAQGRVLTWRTWGWGCRLHLTRGRWRR
jgi:hypothetical protein